MLQVSRARQAVFVAQGTVIDDCRVKPGRFERHTFSDSDFRAALRHCRRQTFAGSLQDVTALAEAWLLAALPIHPAQRGGETPSIRCALRFHIVTAQQAMERGFDAPGLAAALSRPDRTFVMLGPTSPPAEWNVPPSPPRAPFSLALDQARWRCSLATFAP